MQPESDQPQESIPASLQGVFLFCLRNVEAGLKFLQDLLTMEARVLLKKPSHLVTSASPNWAEKSMATFFSTVQNLTQSALTEI